MLKFKSGRPQAPRFVSRCIATLAIVFAGATASAGEPVEYVTESEFETVREDLRDAVVNRGYVIDYEAFVGDMLKRTMEDVGASKQVYEDAEFIQFCSAVLSRDAMAADPANIATCPYVLFVYERTDEPGRVHVGFRKLDLTGNEASRQALDKINGVLDEIVREAAGQ